MAPEGRAGKDARVRPDLLTSGCKLDNKDSDKELLP